MYAGRTKQGGDVTSEKKILTKIGRFNTTIGYERGKAGQNGSEQRQGT